MTFALVLAEFREKAGAAFDDAVARTVFSIAANIDYLSPVGNPKLWKNPAPKGYVGGHFRNNWQLGVDVRPSGIVGGIDRSPKNEMSGGTTTARITSVIPDEAGGHVYYLVNNLPYGYRLEFESWSSQTEPPPAMVGRTVEKFQQIVRQAVEGVQ